MTKHYYLSSNGSPIGPFAYEAVLGKIAAKEFSCTDHVYDETVGDWMMLLEHPDFLAKFEQSSPVKKTVAQVSQAAQKQVFKDKEWFVLKDGNNFGPFSQLEIVQMLQQKSLFEFNYIWHSSLPAWKQVCELQEFSAENIRNLKDSKDVDVAEIFFRRRHVRVSYGASLIVHNNKTVFRGRALEISSGGAGILIENADLQPGQSLFLHFQPGTGVPPFNAVCEIVSKQFVSDEPTIGNSVRYGVKFTSLSQTVRESIHNFAVKAA